MGPSPADNLAKWGTVGKSPEKDPPLTLEENKDWLFFKHGLRKDGWGFVLYWIVILFAILGGFSIGLLSNEEKAKTAGFAAAAGALGAVFKQSIDNK